MKILYKMSSLSKSLSRTKSIAFIWILLFSYNIYGQSELLFLENEYNFGEISEVGGSVAHTFWFINKGKSPVKIDKVKASCGCTTSGWSQEEVTSGDSGFVKASYNPLNRPGKFRKSLTIISNNQKKIIYISGYVKSKNITLDQAYNKTFGPLKTKVKYLNLGKITNEKPITKSLDVYNSSDTTFSLDGNRPTMPDYISIVLNPKVLDKKQTGKMEITFDPIKKNDYGYVSEDISWSQGEGISVVTVIEEYFPKMTDDELAAAPKLKISPTNFQFGTIVEGTKMEMEFELYNYGSNKLDFRAIKGNCSCLNWKLTKKSLKKRKKTVLKVILDTKDTRGNQHKSISIFSNDPISPTQIITIKGKVTPKK